MTSIVEHVSRKGADPGLSPLKQTDSVTSSNRSSLTEFKTPTRPPFRSGRYIPSDGYLYSSVNFGNFLKDGREREQISPQANSEMSVRQQHAGSSHSASFSGREHRAGVSQHRPRCRSTELRRQSKDLAALFDGCEIVGAKTAKTAVSSEKYKISKQTHDGRPGSKSDGHLYAKSRCKERGLCSSASVGASACKVTKKRFKKDGNNQDGTEKMARDSSESAKKDNGGSDMNKAGLRGRLVTRSSYNESEADACIRSSVIPENEITVPQRQRNENNDDVRCLNKTDQFVWKENGNTGNASNASCGPPSPKSLVVKSRNKIFPAARVARRRSSEEVLQLTKTNVVAKEDKTSVHNTNISNNSKNGKVDCDDNVKQAHETASGKPRTPHNPRKEITEVNRTKTTPPGTNKITIKGIARVRPGGETQASETELKESVGGNQAPTAKICRKEITTFSKTNITPETNRTTVNITGGKQVIGRTSGRIKAAKEPAEVRPGETLQQQPTAKETVLNVLLKTIKGSKSAPRHEILNKSKTQISNEGDQATQEKTLTAEESVGNMEAKAKSSKFPGLKMKSKKQCANERDTTRQKTKENVFDIEAQNTSCKSQGALNRFKKQLSKEDGVNQQKAPGKESVVIVVVKSQGSKSPKKETLSKPKKQIRNSGCETKTERRTTKENVGDIIEGKTMSLSGQETLNKLEKQISDNESAGTTQNTTTKERDTEVKPKACKSPRKETLNKSKRQISNGDSDSTTKESVGQEKCKNQTANKGETSLQNKIKETVDGSEEKIKPRSTGDEIKTIKTSKTSGQETCKIPEQEPLNKSKKKGSSDIKNTRRSSLERKINTGPSNQAKQNLMKKLNIVESTEALNKKKAFDRRESYSKRVREMNMRNAQLRKKLAIVGRGNDLRDDGASSVVVTLKHVKSRRMLRRNVSYVQKEQKEHFKKDLKDQESTVLFTVTVETTVFGAYFMSEKNNVDVSENWCGYKGRSRTLLSCLLPRVKDRIPIVKRVFVGSTCSVLKRLCTSSSKKLKWSIFDGMVK